jgi:O-antigen ligase
MSLFSLLLIVIPSNISSKAFFSNMGTPARFAGVLLLFLSVVGFLASTRKRSTENCEARVNPGVVILVFYLSLMFIVWGAGFFIAGTQVAELSKATSISGIIIGVGVGIYSTTRIDTSRKRSIVLASLLLGVTYSAVVGILQHTEVANLAETLKPPSYEIIPHYGAAAEVAERAGSIRAYGTLIYALPFGAVCASAVPLAVHFASYSSTGLRRAFAGVAALILLVAVPTSIGRSSLIALGVALSFYAISLKLRRLATLLIILVTSYLLFAITRLSTFQSLADTIANSSQDPSVLIRVVQIDTMMAIFRQHPVSGVGLGSVTVAEFGPVDNYWAIALAEGGTIGFVAFSALCLGGVFGIAAAIRRSTTDRDRDQNYAVGAMFLALLAVSPTFDSLAYDSIFFITFLVFGILWSGTYYSTIRIPR